MPFFFFLILIVYRHWLFFFFFFFFVRWGEGFINYCTFDHQWHTQLKKKVSIHTYILYCVYIVYIKIWRHDNTLEWLREFFFQIKNKKITIIFLFFFFAFKFGIVCFFKKMGKLLFINYWVTIFVFFFVLLIETFVQKKPWCSSSFVFF